MGAGDFVKSAVSIQARVGMSRDEAPVSDQGRSE